MTSCVLFLSVSLSLLISIAFSSQLGESCQSAKDCSVEHSTCAPMAESCSSFGSFCQCQPGLANIDGRCKKVVNFDDDCGYQSNAVCPKSMFCNAETAKCECKQGYYKIASNLTENQFECVLRGRRGKIMEKCVTSPENSCGDNLECFQDVCSCKLGYAYDDFLEECIPINFGGHCYRHEDCINVLDSVCNIRNQKCDCPSDRIALHVSFKGKKTQACVNLQNSPKFKNERCSEDRKIFCQQGLVCTMCNPVTRDSICVSVEDSQHSSNNFKTSSPSFFPNVTEKPETTQFTVERPDYLMTKTTPTTTELMTTDWGFFMTSDSIWNLETSEMPFELDSTPPPTTSTSETSMTTIAPVTTTPNKVDAIADRSSSKTDTEPVSTPANSVAKKMGDKCRHDTECLDISPLSRCKYNVCTCKHGYVQKSDEEKCSPARFVSIPLGDVCHPWLTGDSCADSNAACIDLKCKCQKGFYEKNGRCFQKPMPLFSDSCSIDEDCGVNFTCRNLRCECREGYKLHSDTTCLKRILGEKCQVGNPSDCQFISKAECSPSTSRCECRQGLVQETDEKCVTPKVDLTCVNDIDCEAIYKAPVNSICSPFWKKCQCADYLIFDKYSNSCETWENFQCDYDYECPSYSICSYQGRCTKRVLTGKANRLNFALSGIYLALVALVVF